MTHEYRAMVEWKRQDVTFVDNSRGHVWRFDGGVEVLASFELTPLDDMPCQLTFFQLSSELKEEQAYGARETDVFQSQSGALPRRKDS